MPQASLPPEKIKILLVSASTLWAAAVRSVLAALPDVELLETARGSLTGYQAIHKQQPHILIIDDSLPTEEGLTIVSQIREEQIPLHIIVMVATTQNKQTALAAGVDTVIFRSGSSRQLETAVLNGRKHIQDGC